MSTSETSQDTPKAAEPPETNLKPPYTSYKGMENLLSEFASNGIPDHINPTLFRTKSGSYRTTMIASLRFLGLIDDEGTPQQSLKDLVDAISSGGDVYKEFLADLLNDRYTFLKEERIDLSTGTTHQLLEIFRGYGATGSTLQKAIVFFLAAAKAAGFEIGPYMTPPQAQSTPSPTRRRRRIPLQRVEQEETKEKPPEENTTPSGMIRIPIPLFNMEDGAILLPDGLSDEEWEYAHDMAKMILERFRRLPRKDT